LDEPDNHEIFNFLLPLSAPVTAICQFASMLMPTATLPEPPAIPKHKISPSGNLLLSFREILDAFSIHVEYSAISNFFEKIWTLLTLRQLGHHTWRLTQAD
jgi:hypothetical protein